MHPFFAGDYFSKGIDLHPALSSVRALNAAKKNLYDETEEKRWLNARTQSYTYTEGRCSRHEAESRRSRREDFYYFSDNRRSFR